MNVSRFLTGRTAITVMPYLACHYVKYNKRLSATIMAVSDWCVWASALHGLLTLTANTVHCSHLGSAGLASTVAIHHSHDSIIGVYIEVCVASLISTVLSKCSIF